MLDVLPDVSPSSRSGGNSLLPCPFLLVCLCLLSCSCPLSHPPFWSSEGHTIRFSFLAPHSRTETRTRLYHQWELVEFVLSSAPKSRKALQVKFPSMAETQMPTMMSLTSPQSKTGIPLHPEISDAFVVHVGTCSSPSSAGTSVHLILCGEEGIVADSGHCSRWMWPYHFGLAVSGWGFVWTYICSSYATDL